MRVFILNFIVWIAAWCGALYTTPKAIMLAYVLDDPEVALTKYFLKRTLTLSFLF
jgi:hypothetical protein